MDLLSPEYALPRDNENINLVCAVGQIKIKTTRKNTTIAYVTLEDLTGSIEMLVFQKVLDEFESLLYQSDCVVVNARISVREDDPVKLICNSVHNIDEFVAQNPKKQDRVPEEKAKPQKKQRKLYLKVPKMNGDVYTMVMATVKIFNGPIPLVIYNCEDGKYYSAPQSMSVSEDRDFLGHLSKILGEENVVLT